MAVTASDIARQLGIHQTVVSRVLSTNPTTTVRVSAATKQKILTLAGELGYRPNHSARSMRRGRTGTLALILPAAEHSGYMPAGFVHELSRQLGEREMHLVVATVPDGKLAGNEPVSRIFPELVADALIMTSAVSNPQGMVPVTAEHAIPLVWINVRCNHDAVYPDDINGAQALTQRLIERGHRRIGYIHFPAGDHYSLQDRLAGYRSAMARAGLKPDVLACDYARYRVRHTLEGDRRIELTQAWLARPDRPTAVVAYEAQELSVVTVVAARLGLQIPRDLSLVGFHDEVFQAGGQAIATMIHSISPIVSATIEMVMNKTRRPDLSVASVAVPYTWFEADSVLPPRYGSA